VAAAAALAVLHLQGWAVSTATRAADELPVVLLHLSEGSSDACVGAERGALRVETIVQVELATASNRWTAFGIGKNGLCLILSTCSRSCELLRLTTASCSACRECMSHALPHSMWVCRGLVHRSMRQGRHRYFNNTGSPTLQSWLAMPTLYSLLYKAAPEFGCVHVYTRLSKSSLHQLPVHSLVHCLNVAHRNVRLLVEPL
jgi:hypothetical protein